MSTIQTHSPAPGSALVPVVVMFQMRSPCGHSYLTSFFSILVVQLPQKTAAPPPSSPCPHRHPAAGLQHLAGALCCKVSSASIVGQAPWSVAASVAWASSAGRILSPFARFSPRKSFLCSLDSETGGVTGAATGVTPIDRGLCGFFGGAVRSGQQQQLPDAAAVCHRRAHGAVDHRATTLGDEAARAPAKTDA